MLYGETEKREKKMKWRKYLRIFKKYIKNWNKINNIYENKQKY